MNQPKDSLQESIVQQREMLTELLYEPLRQLAEECSLVWGDRTKIVAIVSEVFANITYCKVSVCAGRERSAEHFQHQLQWADWGAFRAGPVRPQALYARDGTNHGFSVERSPYQPEGTAAFANCYSACA